MSPSTVPQRTFAERLPDVVPVAARRTGRLTIALETLAFATGGEAGARLSHRLHMPSSPDTLLRIMRRAACPTAPPPRVLGVDDFALRKGCRYGTLLVDLERRRRIDLLPDRTAPTLRDWLMQHPAVEVIARDRSTESARGATDGAPQAQQVVDRWHLLHNLREALERLLSRCQARLARLPDVSSSLAQDGGASPDVGVHTALRIPTTSERTVSARSREQRLIQYHAVVPTLTCSGSGYSIQAEYGTLCAEEPESGRRPLPNVGQMNRFTPTHVGTIAI